METVGFGRRAVNAALPVGHSAKDSGRKGQIQELLFGLGCQDTMRKETAMGLVHAQKAQQSHRN